MFRLFLTVIMSTSGYDLKVTEILSTNTYKRLPIGPIFGIGARLPTILQFLHQSQAIDTPTYRHLSPLHPPDLASCSMQVTQSRYSPLPIVPEVYQHTMQQTSHQNQSPTSLPRTAPRHQLKQVSQHHKMTFTSINLTFFN